MKPKTLVILLVILVVLAGAGAILIHSRDRGSSSGEMGTRLLAELPVNDIAAIVIETPSATVSLKKAADSWTVEDRFGYPADFTRLSGLMRGLREIKVGRKFEASDTVLKRLSIRSPDDAAAPQEEKGTRVRMKNGKGDLFLDMVLGKTRAREPQKGPPDGQYVRMAGDPDIYLIDKILSAFEGGPETWLKKSPVQVEAKDIRRIACLGPGGGPLRYAFERPAEGKDLELIEPTNDLKIKTSSLNRLASALSSLSITDVETSDTPVKALGSDASVRLDYTLFDGRIYRIYTGKVCSATEPCRIRLEVGSEPPGSGRSEADRPAEGAEKASGEAKREEAKDRVDPTQENERLKPWIFTIPEWQHQAFFTDLDALLEKEVKKTEGNNLPGK